MSAESIIENLLETIRVAINSGDWKVDGANDPDLIIYTATSYLERKAT